MCCEITAHHWTSPIPDNFQALAIGLQWCANTIVRSAVWRLADFKVLNFFGYIYIQARFSALDLKIFEPDFQYAKFDDFRGRMIFDYL